MILLIFGEENFLSLKKLKQIKKKFASKSENLNIKEIEAENFDFSEFSKLVQVTPFLSEKRLIILKNIISGNIKKEDEEKILNFLERIPESTILLFYEENSDFKQKRLAKKIISISKKTWEFKKLKNWQIEKWVKEEISKRGGSITKQALLKLLSFVGENLWQLDSEIEKLLNYKNKNIIEEKDIEELVSVNLNTNIFELIDSIGNKNIQKALKFLNNLIEQGEEIVYILGMIIYQIRNLITIKDLALKKLTKSEIIKKTGKHPFVIEKSLAQIEKFSLEELEKIYNKIFDTELKIKTGKMEPKTALNILVTQLCLKQ